MGNLPSDDTSSAPVDGVLPFMGVSFTTPGVGQLLTDVQLRLAFYSTPDDALVQIAADSGSNTPGSVVATLTPPGAVSGDPATTYTFTPGGPVNLSAATKYWLVVDNSPDRSFEWWGNGGAPTGTATFGAYRETTDGIGWVDYTDGTPAFAINTVPVPEPAATTAVSLALVVAAGLLHWRRQR